jgi:hypothetical protein
VTIAMYAKSSVPFRGPLPSAQAVLVASPRNSSIEEYRWRVSSSDPQTVPSDALVGVEHAARSLPPGSYSSLLVPAGTKARLAAGSYFFESLVVERDGALEIANGSEPVYVWVRRNLTIAGKMWEYSSLPSTLIGYEGTEPPHISATFRGTLIAPNSTVYLPATVEPHSGSFFARAIEVADHAVIEQRTSLGWQVMGPDTVTECKVCAISATATMRRCCAHSNHSGTDDLSGAASAADVASGSSKALETYVTTDECLSRVVPNFFSCEEGAYLVPDACEKLGVGFHPAVSCGER